MSSKPSSTPVSWRIKGKVTVRQTSTPLSTLSFVMPLQAGRSNRQCKVRRQLLAIRRRQAGALSRPGATHLLASAVHEHMANTACGSHRQRRQPPLTAA